MPCSSYALSTPRAVIEKNSRVPSPLLATPKKRFFLLSAHLLDLILTPQNRRPRGPHFLINRHDRTPGARVIGGQQVVGVVFLDAPRGIPGDAGIQAAVQAADDVDGLGWSVPKT